MKLCMDGKLCFNVLLDLTMEPVESGKQAGYCLHLAYKTQLQTELL